MYERIDENAEKSVLDSHIYRYDWAGQFTNPESVVIDAGCGNELAKPYLSGKYIGVDKIKGDDLLTYQPDFDYDVFVGLEIIEHLPNITNFVEMAKKAKEFIIISTPIVPNSNPFHLQQFSKEDIIKIFGEPYKYEQQEDIYGLFAFKRNGNN
jgi:hypothetical protein